MKHWSILCIPGNLNVIVRMQPERESYVKGGEEVSKNLVTAIAEGQKPKYSGSYTDTLTFTVAPKGPYSFDATTADADTLKRSLLNELKAGGTHLTITLAHDANETMFIAIAEALSEGAADGTVCLTINGATTIPDLFLRNIYDFDTITDIENVIRAPSAKIKKVVLTDVTDIGNYAFYDCTNLISVDAPKATTIGDDAFWYCYSLTSVNLPKATTISKSAFEYCAALTTLNLPLANSLGGSFIGCANSLTELRLTARGTISVTTDASAASDKTFYSAPTTQIDLYLNRDKQSEVNNGNTWNGCVFKSITFV